MKHITGEQVYHILQNLSNLEISYIDYSHEQLNYGNFGTYFDYFNNHVIRSHDLSQFYFPLPINSDNYTLKYISEFGTIPEIGTISERLTILPGYDMALAKQFNFPGDIPHKCDYYSMLYLMDGGGSLALDEKTFSLRTGDFCLIPPNVCYALNTLPESICVFLNLRASFLSSAYKDVFCDDARFNDFFLESLKTDSSVTYLMIHTDNAPVIRDGVLDIFAEYINQEKYSNPAMKHQFALLMARILRSKDTEIESSIVVGHAERQYQVIMEYLKQNYQTVTLADVADQLHFSKQYICKIVKNCSGKTFQTLLTDTRLELVKQYLTETDLPIEAIAEVCGFSTAAHLSRVFKGSFGIPPSVYRTNIREHMLN